MSPTGGTAWSLALCVTFVACRCDEPVVANDADAAVDARFEVGFDASFNVGPDASRDVGVDLGRDRGVDEPVTPGLDACDPTAHVDCFFAVECSSELSSGHARRARRPIRNRENRAMVLEQNRSAAAPSRSLAVARVTC